jgi:acetoacetate decarboxylase
MLHGFSVPLTPEGNSALASPPPWHYSSDCLVIEYWTHPAAIAALLPPGVTPDETSRGRAFFWFLDWQFTASNDEITDPARYQYREAFAVANRARLSARHVVLGHRSAYSEELRRLRTMGCDRIVSVAQ